MSIYTQREVKGLFITQREVKCLFITQRKEKFLFITQSTAINLKKKSLSYFINTVLLGVLDAIGEV